MHKTSPNLRLDCCCCCCPRSRNGNKPLILLILLGRVSIVWLCLESPKNLSIVAVLLVYEHEMICWIERLFKKKIVCETNFGGCVEQEQWYWRYAMGTFFTGRIKLRWQPKKHMKLITRTHRADSEFMTVVTRYSARESIHCSVYVHTVQNTHKSKQSFVWMAGTHSVIVPKPFPLIVANCFFPSCMVLIDRTPNYIFIYIFLH